MVPLPRFPRQRTGMGSLAAHKKAIASNVFQKNWRFGPERAFDDDESTRWATDADVREAWLEVDLGEPTSIGRAVISEEFDRVQAFELQYKDGEQWKTLAGDAAMGNSKALAFEPVKARHFRLKIAKATDGPSIREFQLFAPPR